MVSNMHMVDKSRLFLALEAAGMCMLLLGTRYGEKHSDQVCWS